MTDLVLSNVDQEKVLAVLGLSPRDPMTQAVLLVSQKYGLDPLLKHIQIIKGNPYVTRDGYLHVAHQSGVFDGLEVLEEKETPDYFHAKVAVYRKDMGRPFVATGRASKTEKGVAPPYEMALARAERRALKRAFDVAGLPDGGDGDYEEIPELVDRDTGEIMSIGSGSQNTASGWGPPSVNGGKRAGGEGEGITTADPALPAMPPLPEEIDEPAAEVDEFDRASLQGRIDKLSLEFRVIASTDWVANELPRVGGITLRTDYDKADHVLGLIEAQQKSTYLARRLEVLDGLESVHIAKDAAKKRHAFIAEATAGETESSKTLTADQRDAVMAMVAEVKAAEEARDK